MREIEPRRDGSTPGGPSDFALLISVLVLVLPVALLVWAATLAWMRRQYVSRWWPAVAAVVLGLAMYLAGGASMALGGAVAAVGAFQVTAWTVGGVLGAAVTVLVQVGLATSLVAVPVGLAAAAMTPGPPDLPGAPSPASRRRVAQKANREIQRVERVAESSLTRGSINSPRGETIQPLGVLAGKGDLPPDWTQGKYLVLPAGPARLPRLVIGRPGQGKSVYLCREVHLAGVDHRQAVVVDCKGEPGFADEVEAAYRSGWEAGGQFDHLASREFPEIHRWPDEPLNGWTGDPAAVANRLLSVWTFDTASLWYREVVDMALTLALQAPGPPVARSRDVLRRIRPGVLAELWHGQEEEAGLVKSLESRDKLDDVTIRLGNLLAALGGLLDGDRPIGESDLTILSLPTMGKEHQAASILRVVLADLAHYVSTRKPPQQRLLVVVDEFSAVPGGREHAIHLTERGRSAGAATVLAVQSARGLGDDDDADRLIGATGMIALFGTAEPERILKLAGTISTARHTSTIGTSTTDTYSEAQEYRVDANDVRALHPGYCYVLASGRAQKIKVLQAPARPAEYGPPHVASSVKASLDPPRGPRPELAGQSGREGSDQEEVTGDA